VLHPATATTLMAHYGRAGPTMVSFAAAMRLNPVAIRRHFPDLDTMHPAPAPAQRTRINLGFKMML